MAKYYHDLREYLEALEKADKLYRIRTEINKDSELHPMVRWQFRGLPEEDRRGFLFENVTDVKGRKYGGSVAVAILGASKDVYALGLSCKPDEGNDRLTQAQLHPIEPEIVQNGPVHEEVHMGEKLLEHGGLDEFPIPI